MRVALAEDGDEAEEVGLVELAALGVGGDQAFAGGLGGGVERGLDREGVGLGRRAVGRDQRLAVDGAGGREGNPAHTVRAHGLEDVEGRDGVLFEVLPRVVPAVLDVGVGGQVEDEVGALHRGGQRGQVEVVAADELEPRVRQSAVEEAELPGGKVVPAGDRDAVREEAVNEVGTDEAGGTGDEGVLQGKVRVKVRVKVKGKGAGKTGLGLFLFSQATDCGGEDADDFVA